MFLRGHRKYLVHECIKNFLRLGFYHINFHSRSKTDYYCYWTDTVAEQLTKLLHEGNFLYAQKKYDEALKSFKKVLALDSKNTFAMDRIGLILYNLGNEKEAIKYFDKSLAIDPNNTGTLNSKGLALGILGNHTTALELFDKALSIDPNSMDAYINKGTA